MNQTPPRVAVLRGVNVSATNRLPMAGFREVLIGLGLTRVETHIQSGNAVFCGGPPDAALAAAIGAAIGASFAFTPDVLLRRLPDLDSALDHPFGPDALATRIHAVFLADPSVPLDENRLQSLRKDEDWLLRPGLLLLHTPSGIGRSKLANALARALPTVQTARNLNTVAALAGMLRSRSRDDGAG